MRVSEHVRCVDFPCEDVRHESYVMPGMDIIPEHVKVVLISEAAPANPADYYYAGGAALFEKTTVQVNNIWGLFPSRRVLQQVEVKNGQSGIFFCMLEIKF